MIILVGASASGKTEIAKELGKLYSIKKAITTTTRKIREGEVDGVDYFFVSKEEFQKRTLEGKFVETASYANNLYGTGKDQIASNKVLIVEPNGLHSFLKLNDPSIISFFIDSPEKLREERMNKRKDKEEDIKIRLERDRIDFSLDKVGKTDFHIIDEDYSIHELSEMIYSLYKKALLERGL